MKALLITTALAALALPAAAQSISPVYALPGGAAGAAPQANLAVNAAGEIYGTTTTGGSANCQCGTIFQTSVANPLATTTLYAFQTIDYGGLGGAPIAPLTLSGANGRELYGYTAQSVPGQVFELSPTTPGQPWRFQTRFLLDDPANGNLKGMRYPLIVDGVNIFGVAGGNSLACGTGGCGSVWRIHDYAFATLFKFQGGATQGKPDWIIQAPGGTVFYVATRLNNGAVVALDTADLANPETVLDTFAGGTDGASPTNLVLLGGTLYGTTTVPGGDAVFALAPGSAHRNIAFIPNPSGSAVTLNAGPAGSLIGAVTGGATGHHMFDYGQLFQLTPNGDGTWTEATTFDFNAAPGTGYPIGTVLDGAQKIGVTYGTPSSPGGEVFTLTP